MRRVATLSTGKLSRFGLQFPLYVGVGTAKTSISSVSSVTFAVPHYMKLDGKLSISRKDTPDDLPILPPRRFARDRFSPC